MAAHQSLMSEALSNWGKHQLYLSLDTTVVWNCFCIVFGLGWCFEGDPARGVDSCGASQ